VSTGRVDRLYEPQELRRAVRVLAAFVADDRAKPTPDVTDALDVYASACRQVNDRLGECFRLIKLGQRSEALRQVKIEPDALAMYDELHFDKVKWLAEVCEECKLTPPPRLDSAAAAKLNEAFATEQKHRDILRQHRLLALSRAPLRRRLEVMRLIRKAAPTELFWQDDIAGYEGRRVEEMRKVLADPKQRDDWPTVRDLYQEMTDGWQSPFPLDLAEQIKKARKKLLEKGGDSELKPIADRLKRHVAAVEDAHDRLKDPPSFDAGGRAAEAFDFAEAAVQKAVAEAEGVADKYDVADGSKLLDAFADATDLLANCRPRRKRWREFEKVVRELEGGLEGGLDFGYLKQYYRVAAEFNLPLPDGVMDRYQRRAGGRKTLFLILGIAGGAVVLLALVAVVVVLLLTKS
jgi:hypothetical protein